LSRQRPERTCLAYLYEGRPEPGSILLNVRNIIGIQAPGKKITRKKFKQSRHFKDTFFGAWFETAPVTNVLFRPEEIHGTSAITRVFPPFPQRYRRVPHPTFRFGTPYYPVFHLHSNWFFTIKTRSIDPYCFSFEEPADRQRFKPSLTEPLLLSFDCDPVLGRLIVERGKGSDKVCIRI